MFIRLFADIYEVKVMHDYQRNKQYYFFILN